MASFTREELKGIIQREREQSLDESVERYLSVDYQWVLGGHHFAHASTECLHLFRDGYFLSCVMISHAVNDGLVKFIAERNGISRNDKENNNQLIRRMHAGGIVSAELADAVERIQNSFRNDYHHMNPPVGECDHAEIAKTNIQLLALIEREIFGCDLGDHGTIVPLQRQYWDIGPDGVVPVYMRCN